MTREDIATAIRQGEERREKGFYMQAQTLFVLALNRASEADQLSDIHGHMVILYGLQGFLGNAKVQFRKCLEWAEKVNDQGRQATAWRHLAFILKEEDLEEANITAQTAYSLAKEAGRKDLPWFSTLLVEINSRRGRKAEVIHWAQVSEGHLRIAWKEEKNKLAVQNWHISLQVAMSQLSILEVWRLPYAYLLCMAWGQVAKRQQIEKALLKKVGFLAEKVAKKLIR